MQALGGFIILVNSERKIEFVTENVSQFIKFPADELTGKIIYNILHVGDHTKFNSLLMTVGKQFIYIF